MVRLDEHCWNAISIKTEISQIPLLRRGAVRNFCEALITTPGVRTFCFIHLGAEVLDSSSFLITGGLLVNFPCNCFVLLSFPFPVCEWCREQPIRATIVRADALTDSFELWSFTKESDLRSFASASDLVVAALVVVFMSTSRAF